VNRPPVRPEDGDVDKIARQIAQNQDIENDFFSIDDEVDLFDFETGGDLDFMELEIARYWHWFMTQDKRGIITRRMQYSCRTRNQPEIVPISIYFSPNIDMMVANNISDWILP